MNIKVLTNEGVKGAKSLALHGRPKVTLQK